MCIDCVHTAYYERGRPIIITNERNLPIGDENRFDRCRGLRKFTKGRRCGKIATIRVEFKSVVIGSLCGDCVMELKSKYIW